MTAAEVIEEIKRLPLEGKRHVKVFVDGLDVDSPSVIYATDEEADRAADKVFAKYDTLLKKLAR